MGHFLLKCFLKILLHQTDMSYCDGWSKQNVSSGHFGTDCHVSPNPHYFQLLEAFKNNVFPPFLSMYLLSSIPNSPTKQEVAIKGLIGSFFLGFSMPVGFPQVRNEHNNIHLFVFPSSLYTGDTLSGILELIYSHHTVAIDSFILHGTQSSSIYHLYSFSAEHSAFTWRKLFLVDGS